MDFMLAKEYTPNMKLPKKLQDNEPPIGWYMSEKLDGYRARYDPNTISFVSRQNKPFHSPIWFTNFIGDYHLDGELFCGRDDFQSMGVVRKKTPIDEEWKKIKYCVYDAPEIKSTFCERYQYLHGVIKQIEQNWNQYRLTLDSSYHTLPCPIVLLNQIQITSFENMEEFYKLVLSKGGEGIMLKHPGSEYTGKRSDFMLKYKPCFDSEAIIVNYTEGSGKYKSMLGAFVCKPLINKGNESSIDEDETHIFNISGMDDEIRQNFKSTHPIGTIITYEYSGKTGSGKPRFARYIRKRDDITVVEIDKTSTQDIQNCINILKKISSYEKFNGNNFKVKAYEKSIDSLKTLNNDSELISSKLLKLPGIGKSIAEKIEQIINTGTCPVYESIKNIKNPKEEFMKIHGVGVTKANQLLKNGFKSIDDLKKCENISDYLNSTQIKALPYVEDLEKRIPYETIQKHEELLKQALQLIDPTAELTIAGSYRRKCKDSGDIDILVKTPNVKNNSIYLKFIEKLIEINYIKETLSLGNKKFMGICREKNSFAKRIDIMYTKPEEYPFAILYFTGSKKFNTNMRGDLLSKGLTLNEYSLKYNNTKKKVTHKFYTENDIFNYIGYDYIEPENR